MAARSRPPRLLLLTLVLAGAAGVFWAQRGRIAPETNRGERVESAAPPTVAGVAAPLPRPAAATAPSALFAFARPANSTALDAALPAPARQVQYVRLDTALITGKHSPFWQKPGAGRVVLPLPDGGSMTVVIDDSEMLGADRWTSTGHVEGRPQSQAVFAWNRGFLHASIADAELGSFALRAATEELSQFYQVDPSLVPPCGGGRPVSLEKALVPTGSRPRAAAGTAGDATSTAPVVVSAAENPQRAEVHVMMVYTQSVLATLGEPARSAALQSAFDAEIAKVNAAFAASLITARVKLVQLVETQYNENASQLTAVQTDALTALASVADGKMDELHALRDQVGADLVCLALNRADALSSGLGFVLDEPGRNDNHLYSFSVVQYANMAGTTVVPHELGHNFGCAHDLQNAFGGHGAYPYSYGYRFTASDGRQYRDIMAYPPGTALTYFSNPLIGAPSPAPAGSPGGIAAGLPGESNTALTIEKDAFEVANYRLQTQAAPNPGTLVNVATRAYVGTGEQVLIGGFVINGTAPKRMLIRAAGPALAGFGVRDALAAPVLDLYTGSTLFASNTDWNRSTDAAAIAAAAAQVGAFAFPAGSTDSALLITLAPGSYTAVVRGAGGATGSALVEAYEVGTGANKIVNLSTRGYADNAGKEMLGGFVVRGDPGTTKRILIRVLGPSLARLGLTGVLYDPFMEIHNAAGDLVMFNDDWSSGTTAGSASAVNDFSPLVNLYNEKQIAATGFAPSNRREPCLMADLPPGSYTVVVKPFEKLDGTAPQLAEPGVGIVEVYEINP